MTPSEQVASPALFLEEHVLITLECVAVSKGTVAGRSLLYLSGNY